MSVIFKYEKEKSRIHGEIKRPKGEIILKTSEGETKIHCYIDSGADITLIPRIFGNALGFELKEEEIIELKGISEGSVPAIIKEVEMKIGEHCFISKIAWCLIEDVPPLLGRKDIFDKFNISFKEKEGIIEFEWVGD